MKILVTGAAGFIGAEVALKLLERGDEVIGLDNLNNYYDVSLKEARLERIVGAASAAKANFTFIKSNLEDQEAIQTLFTKHNPQRVINLAAQAGVRYSFDHPMDYVQSNIVGFANLLEACRHYNVEHLVYASSSSVYGANASLPYSEHDNVDHPLNIYAASKKANELMAHSYSALFGIHTTGLRFYTVYGPWGRPDMAPILFTEKIQKGEQINVFNHGNYSRDFKYIDDIVEGVIRVLDCIPAPNPDWNAETPDPASSNVPWRIYNIGNSKPVVLSEFIECLEKELGVEADKNYMPAQKGEVDTTWADVSDLKAATGYNPDTPLTRA